MPYRLREARKLAGFVALMPVQRRAEFWFGDFGRDRPTVRSPATPVRDAEDGLSTEAEAAPTEPDDAAIAHRVAADQACEELGAGESDAAPARPAEPGAGIPALAVAGLELAPDAVAGLDFDDAVPAMDVAETDFIPAVDDETEAAGDPPASAAVEPDDAVAPPGAPEPASPEAGPPPEATALPAWRLSGRWDGGGTQGEDFLSAIRSVLNDATRYDSQMSAALIDLHLDLVIRANGQRQAVANAAEEVRHASIGLFTALYRPGSAENERVMAKVATDRLEASLGA